MKQAIEILKKSMESLYNHRMEASVAKEQVETNLKHLNNDLEIYDKRLQELEDAIEKLEKSDAKPKNKKA